MPTYRSQAWCPGHLVATLGTRKTASTALTGTSQGLRTPHRQARSFGCKFFSFWISVVTLKVILMPWLSPVLGTTCWDCRVESTTWEKFESSYWSRCSLLGSWSSAASSKESSPLDGYVKLISSKYFAFLCQLGLLYSSIGGVFLGDFSVPGAFYLSYPRTDTTWCYEWNQVLSVSGILETDWHFYLGSCCYADFLLCR